MSNSKKTLPTPGVTTASTPVQQALVPDERPQTTHLFVPLGKLHLEGIVAPDPSRDLVASIKALGVLSPLLVTKRPGGEQTGYDVRDGRRRALAARAARLLEVPAVLIPPGVSGHLITLIGNHHRSPNEAADHLALQDLLQAGYSEEQIGSAAHLGKATIKALRLLENLPAELRALVTAAPPRIPLPVAREIARLSRPQQLALAALYRERLRDARDAHAKQARALQDAATDDQRTRGIDPGPCAEPTLTLGDVRTVRTAHRAAVVTSLAAELGLVQPALAGTEPAVVTEHTTVAGLSGESPAPHPASWQERVYEKVREALALLPLDAQADRVSTLLRQVADELKRQSE